ncbi:MAG: KaiC/GvpD/RAD55 family RecA-like ATPase [Halobacteriales archaeon]|jgi:KaiC/GvpD/RAD55 family RecA-like ATPase
MDRLPTGISRFDSMIGGGAPAGSVVLLASEGGAGGREFMYTSAVMNALARADDDQFGLHYGQLDDAATLPEGIHYVSFTADRSELIDEMRYTLDADLLAAGADAIEFADLSTEFFGPSPIPTDWYAGRTRDLTSLGDDHDQRGVLEALGTHLSENASDNLVLLDSVSDLLDLSDDRLEWTDVTLLMRGLKKASARWGGLVLILVNQDPLAERQLGSLMDATDGTLLFEWESGGSERARTLVVRQFRGVLSRLEAENIIQFETEISEGGFDISDVRKIR